MSNSNLGNTSVYPYAYGGPSVYPYYNAPVNNNYENYLKQQQLQMQSYLASLAASQNAQTGQILTDNAAQTTALLRALNPTPVPAYIVSNPNGCNCGSYGCGA